MAQRSKGYDEDFADFWRDDLDPQIRQEKLIFWQWCQRQHREHGDVSGNGPAKVFYTDLVDEAEFYPVDAWDLRQTLPDIENLSDLLHWCREHVSDFGGTWPVMLAFFPSPPPFEK